MTPTLLIRPVLVCLLAASASACGMVEDDPNRFENLATGIARIPVTQHRPGDVPVAYAPRTAEEAGLRSPRAPLKVEVLDPHDLWDARDGMVQQAMAEVAPAVVEAAAPAVTRAVIREIERPAGRSAPRPAEPAGDRPSERAGLRPASRLVQLGAFGSHDAARAAWTRLSTGSAARALSGVQPVYEAVEVNGRRLVRLKVPTPRSGAAAVCAAAGIEDPWCRRGV
ncbi:SPOR domain-containing protein [Rhizobium sp. CRIBSB]|nr:SPOR domain-containing protein [Rhizobium sp. CRIBSB]